MDRVDILKAVGLAVATGSMSIFDGEVGEFLQFGIAGFMIIVAYRIWKEAEKHSDNTIDRIIALTNHQSESIKEITEAQSQSLKNLAESMTRSQEAIVAKMDESHNEIRDAIVNHLTARK